MRQERGPAVNPYLPMRARVIGTRIETDDRMLKTIDLSPAGLKVPEGFPFKPGQFCEISIFGRGEAPFGIASSPTEVGFLRFTVNRAGLVTAAIHRLEKGDEVGLRGPFGKAFPIDLFEGNHVVVIGGGFAFTTLRSLVVYMLDKQNRSRFGGITVIYGARSPGLLLYREELTAWGRQDDLDLYVTVDQGDQDWDGLEGFVPDVVARVAPSAKGTYAVVCGPPIMIKFTLPRLLELGFQGDQIYTSLERRMKCGLGKCGRCNIGHLYVCKDGPVFSYAQLARLVLDD
ncbi:MAG: FAD/NAD(P)-binding protein [Deltaproteobacteria bacterium]|nr:FAD/NAD(P)-binding protein [Deltaproteobacteria bacterium]